MELSIGVSTCGRPRLLKRCLNSIRRYTKIPLKFIVVDNTKAFTDKYHPPNLGRDVEYIEVEDRKIGCSETNNILFDACETEYLMYVDDDIYLQQNGLIDILLRNLKELEKVDIKVAVGGSWYDTYYKSYRHCSMKYLFGYKDGLKYVKKYPIPFQVAKQLNLDWIMTDELLHSMIINKTTFQRLGIKWDNNFEWKGDRLDYFLTLKTKFIECVQYTGECFIHDPQPFKYGSLSYEFDGKKAIAYFKKKWNIIPLVGWDKFQDKPRL